jgi:hypothetical protein
MHKEENQDNHERGFKGVWIPAAVWTDKNLSWMEKLFIVEIDSLDNDSGCYASNGYFSLFFNLSKQRCSQVINSLKEKKYISIEYIRDGVRVEKRVVKILCDPIKNTVSPIKNTGDPIKNTGGGYQEKLKENNTLFNNTYNNTDNKYSRSDDLAQGKHAEKIIQEIYNAYPVRCPIRGSSTGKGSSCKSKIKTLLKTISSDDLKETIRLYIADAVNTKTYVKNFKTFLNNLPDLNDLKGDGIKNPTGEIDATKRDLTGYKI